MEHKEIINQILDEMVRIRALNPHFELSVDERTIYFSFYTFVNGNIYYIEKDGNRYWSQCREATEENLKYLLEGIEKMNENFDYPTAEPEEVQNEKHT